jgi:hypothetical protein
VSDLLSFIVPSRFIHFTGNATENGAYIGLPLLMLFAAGLVFGRRTLRWAGLMTLVVAILSMGPHLHIGGHITSVWLPWAAVEWLPLLGSALPGRLMAIAFLGVGIVVAWTCAEAFERGRPWRAAAAVLLLAGVAALLPALPAVPYPSVHADAPAFFKPGGGVEGISSGSVVLVTPFSSKESTDAMYWQAVADYRFKMPEGDAFTPGPYLGPRPSFVQRTLDEMDAGRQPVTLTSEVRAKVAADLSHFRVTTIVAGPSPGRASIVAFWTEFVGEPPVEAGGVEVWSLPS